MQFEGYSLRHQPRTNTVQGQPASGGLPTRMETRELYLSIASGRRGGAAAFVTLNALRPASYLYGGLLWTRGLLYRHGVLPTVRLPLPVISVGNITLGGTGKTPLVELLARFLTERGKKVAILSRGYAGTNGTSDEFMEFRERLPHVPFLLGKDRLASARTAIEEFHPQCLLLDDGFQHWGLARDLDIVVIDTLSPFGSGHLLPAGTLREPPSSLKRAGLFVLSRTNLCPPERLQDIKGHLLHLNSLTPIIETVHHPLYLEDMNGNRVEVSYLNGKKTFAFCGLGNPTSFEKTLQSLGANVVGFKSFSDHHHYTPEECKGLTSEAIKLGAEAIVTTCKDRVKLVGAYSRALGRFAVANNTPLQDNDCPLPFFALRIEMRITRGQEALASALSRILPLSRPS
ncbi:MAG TPA: tetraacyldisaccharide 4'-kinase [Candidatus Tripitaka californicus]|uniref:tetraacyldisaccharide 4'-kinase n=1 Tax=Candidatus Tripitaka californicus TaxID=3367616 RepID=UPI004026511F